MTSSVRPLCGVLLSAFSNDSFVWTSALVAQHVASMDAPRGWCPLQPNLNRYPVVLATDLSGPVARAAVSAALSSAAAVRFDVLLLGTLDRPRGSIPAPFYGWRRGRGDEQLAWKWWRPVLYLHSPFELSLSLDTDALPCSSASIASAFGAFISLARADPSVPLAAPQYIASDRELRADAAPRTLLTRGAPTVTPLREAAVFTGAEAATTNTTCSVRRHAHVC